MYMGTRNLLQIAAILVSVELLSGGSYDRILHFGALAGKPPLGSRLCELEDHSSKPTWDDCEQLLQVHFTTKKRQRILLEARKNVPGSDGRPSLLPVDIEARFPLTWPNWDFNTPEGPRGQDGTAHLDLITTRIQELAYYLR